MAELLKSLKLIADPNRLRILLLLDEEELTVAELQEVLGMAQSRTSAQLSQLRESRLVCDQRRGRNSFYSCCAAREVLDIAQLAAKDLPERDSDRKSLRHILLRRRDKSRAYFNGLAGKFGRQYVPGRSWKSLAEGLIGVMTPGIVVDLGAGEGTLAQLLARRADQVIAIDNSPAMVEFGTEMAVKNEMTNLEYRLGHIESPPVDDGSVDLAIFSQALHHAELPNKALEAAYMMLKPGGKLLILDLFQHDFDRARELYADVWLGFSEVELVDMLENTGFEVSQVTVVDREEAPPHFQTLLAIAEKKGSSTNFMEQV